MRDIALFGGVFVVLVVVIGLAGRALAKRRGTDFQAVIDIQCEPLANGLGWRASMADIPGLECVGQTRGQALGRAVQEWGKRLALLGGAQ